MKQHTQPTSPRSSGTALKVALFWAYVALPLAWGVSATIHKAMALFA